jgi:hypothetical protein
MLNPTSLLADELGRNLAETYRRSYGEQEPHLAAGLDEVARLVIERIGSSDALYNTPHSSPCASRTFCAAVASSGSSRPAIGRIRFWPR